MRLPIFAAIAIYLSLLGSSFGADKSAIIVNASNVSPIKELDISLALVGQQKRWSEGHAIVIAMLKNEGECEAVLKEYTGMSSKRFKNHWQQIVFTGRGQMPKLFKSSKELVEFVKQTPGAIGVVPNTHDFSKVRKLN